jgi:hypothetical protein
VTAQEKGTEKEKGKETEKGKEKEKGAQASGLETPRGLLAERRNEPGL